MTDDLLAPYRKTPTTPVGRAVPTDSDEYTAFGVRSGGAHRLRIRSLAAPVNSPGYNILLNVVYDGEGTNFMLVYTVLMVLVKGRNLQKLTFAIENGHADYIQQFDPAKWQKPAAADAAVIDSIEVRTITSGNTETEH